MVENAQLWQFFKDEGISIEEVAESTGRSLGYMVNILQGRSPLTDSIKYKILKTYPATAAILLGEAIAHD